MDASKTCVAVGRVDATEAFIGQGINDTSLPYKSRSSLPETLHFGEAPQFLEWQDRVSSDIPHLEQGKHVRISNGDALFESGRKRLGVGSQGSTVVDKVTSKATVKVYAAEADKSHENFWLRQAGAESLRKRVEDPQKVADENLKQYMTGVSQLSAKEQARFRTYFGCLAHTVRFLHDPNIEVPHKDIKPENVLLKNGHLILTDFGTAFDWSKTGQSMTLSNAKDSRTPRYQSPESALGEFHRSSDIWSLGVMFLEMVTSLRGKTLGEMDFFLQGHGQCATSIHLNIEGAMNWFEQLQAYHFGSPIDNEP
ncbi:MAG: hypothetical protein Q9191_002687 [Dirinaria sp. TL-2023a]